MSFTCSLKHTTKQIEICFVTDREFLIARFKIKLDVISICLCFQLKQHFWAAHRTHRKWILILIHRQFALISFSYTSLMYFNYRTYFINSHQLITAHFHLQSEAITSV